MIEFGFLFSSLLIIFSPWIMSSISVLNYYLKMNNPKYVFSARGLISPSVSIPRIEQCDSPFSTLKLLHFSFPVCVSDIPPPLSKVQKTLSFLAFPVLSHLQYPVVTHVVSQVCLLCCVTNGLMLVQALVVTSLNYSSRLLFEPPDFRLAPAVFPYCYQSDLSTIQSDHIIP